MYLPNRELFSHFKLYYLKSHEVGLEIRLDSLLGRSPSVKPQGVARSIPVLVYHGILDTKSPQFNLTVSQFADQMEALKRAGYHTVTMAQFRGFMAGKLSLPQKSFLLTFDDGRKDSFYGATPILSALGFHAVMFVIANEIDSRGVFYLDRSELLTMEHSGTWELELHTYAGHGYIPTGPNGQRGYFFSNKMWLAGAHRMETDSEYLQRVSSDLRRGIEALKQKLHVTATAFAYPFGEYGQDPQVSNYAGAEHVLIAVPRKDGLVAFAQGREGYTCNYPGEVNPLLRIDGASFTSGAALVARLAGAAEKTLPYSSRQADGVLRNEWQQIWGGLSVTDGRLAVSAAGGQTSACTLLDGTRTWSDYTFSTRVHWVSGKSVMLVARYRDANDCVLLVVDPSTISIQESRRGAFRTIASVPNPGFHIGDSARLAIRVVGRTIAGFVNGRQVVAGSQTSLNDSGGVGLKVWDPRPDAASMVASDVTVTKDQRQ